MPAYDVTLTAVFINQTSIPENIAEGLKIYPNPAQTTLWVELNNPDSQKLDILLTNIQGQGVDSKTIEEKGKIRTWFNVSELDPGIYLVSIKSEKFTVIRKVVIKP
jgi:hypothetical protein